MTGNLLFRFSCVATANWAACLCASGQDSFLASASTGLDSWRSIRENGLTRSSFEPTSWSTSFSLGWEVEVGERSVIPVHLGLAYSSQEIVTYASYPVGFTYDSLRINLYQLPVVLTPSYVGAFDGLRIGLRAEVDLHLGGRVSGIREYSQGATTSSTELHQQAKVDGFGGTQFRLGLELYWRVRLSGTWSVDIGGYYSRGLIPVKLGQLSLGIQSYVFSICLRRKQAHFRILQDSTPRSLEY